MSTKDERLDLARWILERNLAWIAAAEVKVGVIITLDIAMLGALAAALSTAAPGNLSLMLFLLIIFAFVALAAAVLCCAMSVLPRVSGPESSLLFFVRIAERTAEEYKTHFHATTPDALLDDCLAQIHRNAEIACEKFKYVRRGMVWSFLAVIPWLGTLTLLVRA